VAAREWAVIDRLHLGCVPARGALLSLVVLLFGLGCSGARGDGRRQLTFWALGREGEEVRKLLDRFEQEHPDIAVRVQTLPWTAAHEKLLTAFVGRQTPDLVQLGNSWVAEFAEIGALEPLDARISRSRQIAESAYFAGVWQANVLQGVTYAVPWYVDTRLLFYRSDLLRAAGFQAPPRSWDELRAVLTALKQRSGPAQWPIFLPTDEWAQPAIFGMQAGSPLLRDGDRYGSFATPEFRRAAEFYVGLFRDGLAPRANNREVINAYQQFAAGDIQMWITGPWNLGEFRRFMPADRQDDWATAPLPAPDGDAPGLSLAGGSSLAIFRGSPYPDETWQLIEFLSRPDSQQRFYEIVGDLPPRKEPWDVPPLAGDRQAAAFREQLQRVQPMPRVPETEQIAQILAEEIERAIRGGADLDEVLTTLDRKVDRALAKRRWMLERRARGGQ
jgi:multiple sugar transport system substrate-binding protein